MQTTESTQSSSFEQQFSNKETLHFKEGKIDVVDIAPKNLREETPILLVPGWSENPSTYKDSLNFISDQNRRVLSLGYSPNLRKIENDGQYPDVELQKANLLLDVLKQKGIEKIDVIAHSEGAINVLIAAMIDPSYFRNVVLDKPAGLIGHDSKRGLISRFISLMKQEIKLRPLLSTDPNSALTAAARVTAYLAEHPVRVMKELDALTSYEITDLIKDLREKEGVMFSVFAGVDDPLFPAFTVGWQIKNTRQPIEGFYSVRDHGQRDLGHNALSLRPEVHARESLRALDDLQRKREKIGLTR